MPLAGEKTGASGSTHQAGLTRSGVAAFLCRAAATVSRSVGARQSRLQYSYRTHSLVQIDPGIKQRSLRRFHSSIIFRSLRVPNSSVPLYRHILSTTRQIFHLGNSSFCCELEQIAQSDYEKSTKIIQRSERFSRNE
jgi:hypothetical protein